MKNHIISITSQATYYPYYTDVYIPYIPILKGFESKPSSGNGEGDLERSIRRSKKAISDYIICNKFDMFVTFTFKSDRQNVETKRQQMSDWLRNQRKLNGKFNYIIVPEFHRDKKSLHFHALFGGYTGKVEKMINPKTGKHLRKKSGLVYKLPSYTLGFNNFIYIKQDLSDYLRVSSYVSKYITKDMPKFFGKQRYWASKGLLLPEVEDNPDEWYLVATPTVEFRSEFGRVLRFFV